MRIQSWQSAYEIVSRSSRGLLCLFTRVNLFVRDSEGLHVPVVMWLAYHLEKNWILMCLLLCEKTWIIEIKVRLKFAVECCCICNLSDRSLQNSVVWWSSILGKENMFRNNISVVFPAVLPESRNFGLVRNHRLICIFLSGFTTV